MDTSKASNTRKIGATYNVYATRLVDGRCVTSEIVARRVRIQKFDAATGRVRLRRLWVNKDVAKDQHFTRTINAKTLTANHYEFVGFTSERGNPIECAPEQHAVVQQVQQSTVANVTDTFAVLRDARAVIQTLRDEAQRLLHVANTIEQSIVHAQA